MMSGVCDVCAGEVERSSKKMSEVKECDVPVVDEAYLEDAGKGGALLKIPTHTISSWGAPRHSLTAEEMTDCGSGSFKSSGTPLTTALPLACYCVCCRVRCYETYCEGKFSSRPRIRSVLLAVSCCTVRHSSCLQGWEPVTMC